MAANWVFFGLNLHPESFYTTELFHRYWIEGSRPVNFGYGALMVAMMGGYWWLVWGGRGLRPCQVGWRVGGLVALVVTGVLAFHGLPLGPMKTALEGLLGDGPAGPVWLLLLMVMSLGWVWAPRSIVAPAMGALLLQGVFFSLLPLWFERFAWWGTVAVLVLFAAVRGESLEEDAAPPPWVLPAGAVIGVCGFVAYAFMGRL